METDDHKYCEWCGCCYVCTPEGCGVCCACSDIPSSECVMHDHDDADS